MEEPVKLQSMRSQRVGHNLVTEQQQVCSLGYSQDLSKPGKAGGQALASQSHKALLLTLQV